MADVNFDNAIEIDVTVRRNDSIDIPFIVSNKDNSVYDLSVWTSAKMQVKINSEDVASILEFIYPTDMTFDTGTGTITVTKDKEETDIVPATYVYDLEVESATKRKTLIKGKFKVQPDVTQ